MHKFDFKNRTAIVTGGAQGFGLDIAKRFLDNGAQVFIWDIDEKLLKSVVDEIKNPNLNFNVVDIVNYKNVEKNVSQITAKTNIDILINNAGLTGPTGPLWEYDVETWNKIVQVNLMGTFNCCRAIVPNMIKSNYGRIVNVASVSGKDGNANASAYSSGKAGAIGLTKALGKELADKNIAVNCITPAAAKTRIFDQISQEHIDYMLSKIPRNRFVLVDELASMVSWMASEENSYTTGSAFDLSGGRASF